MSAARREKSTLGPFTMKKVEAVDFPCWHLSFSKKRRGIRVDLCASKDATHLEVFFSIDRPTIVRISVLEIFENESLPPKEDAISSIAEHILYMVDLAETPNDMASQGREP